MRMNKKWLALSAVLLVLLLTIAYQVREHGHFLIDWQLSAKMAKEDPAFWVSLLTIAGSGRGTFVIVTLLSIASYLLWRDKAGSIWLFLATCAVAFGNEYAKLVLQRERPSLNDFVGGVGYSFPSGHAAMAFGLYIAFLMVAWRFLERSYREILAGAMIMLVLAMGMTRIVLNVHFLSDVIAGYLFAGFLLFSTYAFIEPYRRKGRI
ncbi:phosphatase PAP2 family protein [Exiguobacterium flavidum]|uniref:phosphatase PAP2 family protein n=1 Tax=Exiguobacterium flavidum TaxID=2184695 RepID=UPI000DF7E2F5|nr:phosphatase PAP2 family protein [Exiguobacterium flavidum]